MCKVYSPADSGGRAVLIWYPTSSLTTLPFPQLIHNDKTWFGIIFYVGGIPTAYALLGGSKSSVWQLYSGALLKIWPVQPRPKGPARVVPPQSLSVKTSAAQSHVIKERVHVPSSSSTEILGSLLSCYFIAHPPLCECLTQHQCDDVIEREA